MDFSAWNWNCLNRFIFGIGNCDGGNEPATGFFHDLTTNDTSLLVAGLVIGVPLAGFVLSRFVRAVWSFFGGDYV